MGAMNGRGTTESMLVGGGSGIGIDELDIVVGGIGRDGASVEALNIWLPGCNTQMSHLTDRMILDLGHPNFDTLMLLFRYFKTFKVHDHQHLHLVRKWACS
jgi:hypothetical protein